MSDGIGVKIRPSLKQVTLLGRGLGLIIFVGAMLSRFRYEPGRGRLPLTTTAVSAVIFVGILAAGALIEVAVNVFVRASPDRLEFSNGGRRTVIPWDRVKDVAFDAEPGRLRVLLSDGAMRTFELPYLSGPGGPDAARNLMRACATYRPWLGNRAGDRPGAGDISRTLRSPKHRGSYDRVRE